MIPASHGRAVSCAVYAATSKVRQWAVTLIIGSVPVPALSCVPVNLALVSAGVNGRTASRLAPAGAQRREGVYPFFNLARGLSLASQDVVRGLRQSRQASRRLSHPHCSRNSANSRRHGPVSSMFGFTRTMRGIRRLCEAHAHEHRRRGHQRCCATRQCDEHRRHDSPVPWRRE